MLNDIVRGANQRKQIKYCLADVYIFTYVHNLLTDIVAIIMYLN